MRAKSYTMALLIGATLALSSFTADAQYAEFIKRDQTIVKTRPTTDSWGRPCLDKFRAIAYPVPNSQAGLFEHVIFTNNLCTVPIKLRICYDKTETCKIMKIPAKKTRASITLGFQANMPYFKFNSVEIWDASSLSR